MLISIPRLTALVIDKNEQKTSKPKKINHGWNFRPPGADGCGVRELAPAFQSGGKPPRSKGGAGIPAGTRPPPVLPFLPALPILPCLPACLSACHGLALRSVKQSLKLKNNSLSTSDKKRTSVSTETLYSDIEAQTPMWWVRDDQGGRYGPVSFEVLKSWARDGRIGPANEISKDGVEWSPATAEPDLEMAWVAEVEGGRFYGPIHRDAVQSLINDGAIARSAVLFRRAALEARDAGAECQRLTEALQQALAAREASEAAWRQSRAAREESEEAWRQSLAAREEAWVQARADVAAWVDRFRQAEADLEHARADARDWQTRFQDSEARRGELERRQAEQADAWQRQRQSMQQQFQALEQQAAAWQMQRQNMQQQLQAVEEACQTVQRERADWQAAAQRALAEAATRQQVIDRLEAEADVLRKVTDERSALDAVIDAEVLPPVRPAEAQRLRPPSKPPGVAGAPGEGFTGLSLAELERQAQRELERLGARGPAFFAKKR